MTKLRTAAAIAAAASTGVIGGLLSGVAPATAATHPNVEPIIGSSVLISEIANGGAGATSNANRVSADNFIEITNYGTEPVDISGYRVLRCGQTGDVYGPQKVVPAGTVLAPGDSYTVAGPTADATGVPRDDIYDDTGSNLHEFGFGAMLETPDTRVLDRVGFYHPSVLSECGMRDRALARPLDHRLNQSHQRVARTGDVGADWVVATRTPDAANATQAAPTPRADLPVRITEIAPDSATSSADQFVEITNVGTDAVDVTGWKLYRCGENGTTYIQNEALSGVIAPGASHVIAHADGAYADQANSTTPNGMHFRDFGALVTTADDAIVDRFGAYDNRNSICSDGTSKAANLDSLQGEAYHRVGDSGDNDADFVISTDRTPGVASKREQLRVVKRAPHTHSSPTESPVRISESAGFGPGGASDEFVEIANYGTSPVDLSGWSITRCEGTGRGNAGTQIADLGAVSLAPGQVWVGAHRNASAEVLQAADATWETGVADRTYGYYVRNADGEMVDAIGVYATVDHSPCVIGSEVRGWAKGDLGETYHRARSTGDNEEDFVVAQRSPGALSEVKYVDPTEPLPGELDPVSLDVATAPNTPAVSGAMTGGEYRGQVRVADADGDELTLAVRRQAALDPAALDVASARVFGGATTRKVPTNLSIAGERRLRGATLSARADDHSYPFLRFAVPATEVPAQGLEFTFATSTRERNDLQAFAWDGTAWTLLTHASADADGNVTLAGTVKPEHLVDGSVNVLVIDGPRVAGGLVDEIGVTDRAFADPADYDWAFNHMTDTQFLSEGFRDVFRKMATWVVANAEDRKIGYSTNTGDIIQNWMNANADPVRADKEFAAARRIHDLLNDAGIPNGVLPGNHDNFWGRDNTRYNEFFGPEVFADKEWYGAPWREGDNSAHYDFVTEAGVDYLMVSLPYRPTQAQRDWAREIAATYPRHNVVLLTHSYLDTAGNIENLDNRVTARGDRVWADVVAPSDNVFLVLGGHYHGVATKYGDPVTGEQSDAIEIAADTVAVRNVGETGRTVVQMLADYQGYRSTQPAPRSDVLDRDSGFQRLLQFDVDAELMGVNAYSPHLDSFEAYKYDEPGMRGTPAADWTDGRYGPEDDEFVAKIDLLIPKELTATTWGLGAATTEIDLGSTKAGEPVDFVLPTPAAGERWWVEARDADGALSTSAAVVVDLSEQPVVEPPVVQPPVVEPPVVQPPVVQPPATEPPSAAKAASKARATLGKKRIKVGQRARLDVRVSGAGEATGSVRVTLRSKGRTRILRAELVDGTAKVRLPRLGRGTWQVKTAYSGSTELEASRATNVRLIVR